MIGTLALFPHLSNADCCTSKHVVFRSRVKNCDEYTGARNAFYLNRLTIANDNSKQCSIRLCNDGKPIIDGSYCGRGPCNIFGCNCNCREGNYYERFKAIHGDDVFDIQ